MLGWGKFQHGIISYLGLKENQNGIRSHQCLILGNFNKKLYKLGVDGILQFYVLYNEINMILSKVHGGIVGVNYLGKTTTQKILQIGFFCPILHKDAKEFY